MDDEEELEEPVKTLPALEEVEAVDAGLVAGAEAAEKARTRTRQAKAGGKGAGK